MDGFHKVQTFFGGPHSAAKIAPLISLMDCAVEARHILGAAWRFVGERGRGAEKGGSRENRSVED